MKYMYCSECGQELVSSAKFCNNCGTAVVFISPKRKTFEEDQLEKIAVWTESEESYTDPNLVHQNELEKIAVWTGPNESNYNVEIGNQGRNSLGQKFEYCQKKALTDRLTAVRIYDKWGIVDEKDRFIIDPKYDDITKIINSSFFLVRDNNSFGLINGLGSIIITIEYSDIIYREDGFIIKKDNYFGHVNKEGRVDVLCKYEREPKFFELDKSPFGYFVQRNKKMGIVAIETGTKEVINCEWDGIKAQSKHIFIVKSKGKKGVVNANSQIEVEALYDDVLVFDNTYNGKFRDEFSWGYFFSVKTNNKWGVIVNRDLILPCIYDEIDFPEYGDNVFKAKKDGMFSLFNTKGQNLLNGDFNYIFYGSHYKRIVITQIGTRASIYISDWGKYRMRRRNAFSQITNVIHQPFERYIYVYEKNRLHAITGSGYVIYDYNIKKIIMLILHIVVILLFAVLVIDGKFDFILPFIFSMIITVAFVNRHFDLD